MTYELNATGTGYILKKGIASAKLTIPSTVNNLPVVAIAEKAFQGLELGTTVTIRISEHRCERFNARRSSLVNFLPQAASSRQ